ncbi:MAG: hypothetical protein AAFQ42_04170 [Pseudomonadota bacterium]
MRSTVSRVARTGIVFAALGLIGGCASPSLPTSGGSGVSASGYADGQRPDDAPSLAARTVASVVIKRTLGKAASPAAPF